MCLVFLIIFSTTSSYAQLVPKNWYHLDVEQDSFYGISLQKAYQFLQQKKIVAKPIVVAVLDSGIDTLHEDLKNILWHNPKEIPSNNIDDDNNGYIDDVFGWNFLGNIKGENISKASSEKSRIYYRYKEKFNTPNLDTTSFSQIEKTNFQLWLKASKSLNYSADDEMELSLIKGTLKIIRRFNDVIQKEMGIDTFTAHELEKFEPKTPEAKQCKYGYLTSLRLLEINADEKNSTVLSQLEEYVEAKESDVASKNEEPYNYRKNIVGDDENNIKDKSYGNADVMGPTPNHGTHVSGIIAADRNNKKGMDGIADHAKIMLLRVVPDGDEYDKDVALAIFYAVDHGAKVINMSFGKEFSPQKHWVDSALLYAQQKDVLVVHAAGNDAKNIDSIASYPSPHLLNNKKLYNYITVGASSDFNISAFNLIANFSNYGKSTVDVYAPGVKIYSTLPGGNQYGNHQGTSMAAPVVAGIAAVLRSYFPSLTAAQTKEIILQSVTIPDESITLQLRKNSNTEPLLIRNTCVSGGIANAANAVKLAFTIDQNNKKNMKQ